MCQRQSECSTQRCWSRVSFLSVVAIAAALANVISFNVIISIFVDPLSCKSLVELLTQVKNEPGGLKTLCG